MSAPEAESALDLAKPLRTVSGLKARVVARSKNERYPLGIIVTKEDGSESQVLSYTRDGRLQAGQRSDWDLRNAKIRRTAWIVLFTGQDGRAEAGPVLFPTYWAAEAAGAQVGGLRGIGEVVWEEIEVEIEIEVEVEVDT